MLNVCTSYRKELDLVFKASKTVYIIMCFDSFSWGNPELTMSGKVVVMKESVKHLGNVLTKNLCDNANMFF